MFKVMQDKFLEKLNKRKGEFVPVRPHSPNFTKTKPKQLDRRYLNEGGGLPMSASQPEDKFKAALAKQMSATNMHKSVKPPSSTRAVELAQKRRRDEMEGKKTAAEAKEKEDQERFERQNRVSYYFFLIIISAEKGRSVETQGHHHERNDRD